MTKKIADRFGKEETPVRKKATSNKDKRNQVHFALSPQAKERLRVLAAMEGLSIKDTMLKGVNLLLLQRQEPIIEDGDLST